MKKTILFLVILLANQLQCIEPSQTPDMTPEQKETINNFYRIAGRVIKYHKRVAKGKEVDWRFMVIKNGTTGELKDPDKAKFAYNNKGRSITLFNKEKDYFVAYEALKQECENNVTDQNARACYEILRVHLKNGLRDRDIEKNLEQWFLSNQTQSEETVAA